MSRDFYPSDDARARFLSKLDKNGPVIRTELGPCWSWRAGGYGKTGYGAFCIGHQKNIQAHRASWRLFVGEFQPGTQILHKCDNRNCVNPGHLFAGSVGDNMRDKVRKGRQPRGTEIRQSKLTEEQVRAIRSRYAARELSQERLASEYGVTQAAIWRILRREHWAHVA